VQWGGEESGALEGQESGALEGEAAGPTRGRHATEQRGGGEEGEDAGTGCGCG
jgi:hypothetical protein